MSGIVGHCGMLSWALDQATDDILDEIVIQPPIETITGMNVAVLAFKRAGYWDRFDRLLVPRGIDTEQGGFVDWKAPSISATKHGSASWAQADGFCGSDVAGSYIDTHFTPATDGVNYTLNSGSMGVYVSARPTGTSGAYFGRIDGIANQAIYLTDGVATAELGGKINSSAGGSSGAGAAETGLTLLSRTASNAWRIDVNGVTKLADTDSSGGLSTSSIYLCAQREGLGDFVGKECNVKIAAWWAGDVFTLAEQNEIANILETYFTSVGV